jgi:hypothetical protein
MTHNLSTLVFLFGVLLIAIVVSSVRPPQTRAFAKHKSNKVVIPNWDISSQFSDDGGKHAEAARSGYMTIK